MARAEQDNLGLGGSIVRTALWRNPSFQLMWLSVVATGFGDRMLQSGAMEMLGLRDYEAQRASINAGVMFFFFLPYLVFGPIGGWLADTLPRKWIMLSCDEFRGLMLLVGAIMVAPAAGGALDSGDHWQVYLTVFGVGIFAAMFAPTRNAIIPQIVPPSNLQSANAIILGITTIASLIGVVLAGQILERGSVQAGLYTGVLLFMVSGSFFAFLKVRGGSREEFGNPFKQWRRIAEGMRYIRAHRRIAEMVGMYILFWISAMVFLSAIMAFAKSHYQVSMDELWTRTTIMQAAIGVGMLTGAGLMVWQNNRRESAWLAMIGILGSGLTLALFAFNTWYPLGLLLCFLCGFFGNIALVVAGTLTQTLSANYIRGRVFGARELLSTSGVVLINLVIWRMPDADGWMLPALLVMSGLMITYALIGLKRNLLSGPVTEGQAAWLIQALWRLNRMFVFTVHRAIHRRKDHVPQTGAAILAANHTTGIDGLLIQSATPRIVRWLMLEQYRYRVLNPIWRIVQPVTVDPDRPSPAALRQLLKYLDQGEMIGIFPEGRLQRTERELAPLRQGVAMLARKSGAPVVPIWITGTPRAHSMLLHFILPSRSVVLYGRPIFYDPEAGDQAFVDRLHEQMMRLKAWAEQPDHIIQGSGVDDEDEENEPDAKANRES